MILAPGSPTFPTAAAHGRPRQAHSSSSWHRQCIFSDLWRGQQSNRSTDVDTQMRTEVSALTQTVTAFTP